MTLGSRPKTTRHWFRWWADQGACRLILKKKIAKHVNECFDRLASGSTMDQKVQSKGLFYASAGICSAGRQGNSKTDLVRLLMSRHFFCYLLGLMNG